MEPFADLPAQQPNAGSAQRDASSAHHTCRLFYFSSSSVCRAVKAQPAIQSRDDSFCSFSFSLPLLEREAIRMCRFTLLNACPCETRSCPFFRRRNLESSCLRKLLWPCVLSVCAMSNDTLHAPAPHALTCLHSTRTLLSVVLYVAGR